MLKRNLIVIAIISLAMVFTSSAFGQWNPDIDKVRGKKPVSKTKVKTQSVKSPRDVSTGQSSGKRQQTPLTAGKPAGIIGDIHQPVVADERRANKQPQSNQPVKAKRSSLYIPDPAANAGTYIKQPGSRKKTFHSGAGQEGEGIKTRRSNAAGNRNAQPNQTTPQTSKKLLPPSPKKQEQGCLPTIPVDWYIKSDKQKNNQGVPSAPTKVPANNKSPKQDSAKNMIGSTCM